MENALFPLKYPSISSMEFPGARSLHRRGSATGLLFRTPATERGARNAIQLKLHEVDLFNRNLPNIPKHGFNKDRLSRGSLHLHGQRMEASATTHHFESSYHMITLYHTISCLYIVSSGYIILYCTMLHYIKLDYVISYHIYFTELYPIMLC